MEYVKDSVAEGDKVLLVYDGYRAHISVPVLQFLSRNNIILYTCPGNTSEKTQPIDVVVFSAFKSAMQNIDAD